MSDRLVDRLLHSPNIGHTLTRIGALYSTTLHQKGHPDICCVAPTFTESLEKAFAILDRTAVELTLFEVTSEVPAHE